MRNVTLINRGFAATRTNFPCLYHFWPCYQSEIGKTYLYDVTGGIKLNRSAVNGGVIRDPGDLSLTADGYSVTPGQVLQNSSVTGQINAPMGRQFIFFAVGRFGATGAIQLGNQALDLTTLAAIPVPAHNQSIALTTTNTVPVVSEYGANLPRELDTNWVGYTGHPFTTSSNVYGRAIILYNWDNSGTGYKSVETDGNTVTTVNDCGTTETGGWFFNNGAFDTYPYLAEGWNAAGGLTATVHGFALFYFDNGIPSDYEMALLYMTSQWSNNDPTTNGKDKLIYPGWAQRNL